jgi:hypothetical protein
MTPARRADDERPSQRRVTQADLAHHATHEEVGALVEAISN